MASAMAHRVGKRPDHPAWSIVGKIATVVTIMGFIITILSITIPRRVRLRATAVELDVRLPHDLQTAYTSVRNAESRASLERLLSTAEGVDITARQRELAADAIAATLQSAWGEYWYHLDRYSTSVLIRLANTGHLPAKDVRVVTPFDGLYTLDSNTQPATHGSFAKSIALGSVEPRTQLEITIWTSSLLANEWDAYYVTHADGTAAVDHPAEVYGFLRFVATNGGMLFGLVILALSVALIGTSSYFLLNAASAARTKPGPPKDVPPTADRKR